MGILEETPQPITLQALARRVSAALADTSLFNVWVVAELSDLRVNHGHCYLELMEKHPSTGAILARMRAVIWANVFPRINADFLSTTGQRLASGIKVMVCGTVNYHPAFGMSFVISAIDPAFTMGEAERRRREILRKLQIEGVLELNRSIEWPDVPNRIAIISAPGAAGYGDFIHQLYTNPSGLRFHTQLFPAVMQGERTSPSVIAALDSIAAGMDEFDCVVIIRGGGATSDLLAFDDYELAANIAQFPLPVVIGIGHERDTTVLDYVANMRVKTPTAAAEWLIARGENALAALRRIGAEILQCATDKIAAANTQLAYLDSTLAMAPAAALQRASSRIHNATVSLAGSSARLIAPQLARLEATATSISTAAHTATRRALDRLEARTSLLQALSPEATLRRGYTITTCNGRAVTSISQLSPDAEITTHLADGTVTSTITSTQHHN